MFCVQQSCTPDYAFCARSPVNFPVSYPWSSGPCSTSWALTGPLIMMTYTAASQPTASSSSTRCNMSRCCVKSMSSEFEQTPTLAHPLKTEFKCSFGPNDSACCLVCLTCLSCSRTQLSQQRPNHRRVQRQSTQSGWQCRLILLLTFPLRLQRSCCDQGTIGFHHHDFQVV
jgi:hypothetical protein